MSLETIVSKMIAANEPESNIAKVIKYHKKDSSKINCKKCNHSWKVADGGDDLYMCHECGYNNNKSPLKQTECPEGYVDNNDGLGCVEITNTVDDVKNTANTLNDIRKPIIELTKTPEQVQQQEIEVAELPQSGTVETTLEDSKEEKEEPASKDEWQQLTKEQEAEIYKKYGVANLMPDGTLYPTGTGPVWDQRAEQAVSEIQEANNQVLKQDLINNSDGFTQKLLTKAGISLSEKDGDFIPKLGKGILNIVSSADGMAFVRANNAIQKFNDRVEEQGLKDDDILEYGGFDETQGSEKTLEGFIRKKIDPPMKGTVAEARRYYNEKFIEPLIASEKYQELINSLGNVEILDGKGNFTDKAQQIAGEQLPQVLGALFMTPALYQETTTGAMEIINSGVKREVGEEEFNKLSSKEKANIALKLLNDKKINLEPAIENGAKGAGLDIVSNLFVGSQAAKFIPKKFIRQIVSRNINKELFKQAGKSVLRGSKSVIGEEITEFSQEGLSKASGIRGTDITPTGDMRRSASFSNVLEGLDQMSNKEKAELALQTLVGVTSIGGAGKSITTATTGVKDIILDIQANFDPNTTRAILNDAKKGKELQYIKGEITAKDYNEFLNELEAGEEFVNNSKLKNLSGDKKKKAFDAAVEFKKAEKTIEDTQSSIEQAKKDDNLSAIPDLEQDLNDSIELKNKANKKIIKEVALEARDTDGFNLRDWVNSQTEGVWADKKITTFDTVEQAKEHIEKNYKENLKDEEVVNLLEGDVRNNAIKLGNEAIIVEENVLANLENDDVIGTNAIHHEVTHFILDQATATELKSLAKGVQKELSKSKDPKIQAVLEFALNRKKQYAYNQGDKIGLRGKALNEEFFAAISDGLRDIEINDLQNEEVSLLRGIGNILQNTFSDLTNGELDFDKMNAVNTLQFMKKFNKFNSKDTKIKLNAPKVKGVDVDEVKASKPLSKEELATEFSTLEKGKIPDETAIQAAYAYEPLAKSIANTMYRDYPGFKESGFTRDDFAMELTFGQGANSLLGLAKSYDPKVGSIGGYFDRFLPERAKAVMNKFIGKSATNAGTSLDTTEARELEADEKVDIEAKDAVEALAVPKNILNTVKDDKTIDLMVLSAENEIKKLPKTATDKQKTAARKKGTESVIKKQIAPKLKQELLKTTKNKDDFKKYLDKNWEGVGNAFLNNTDIGKIRNEDTRELLESFEDNGFTKEDIVNYFTDTSLAKNTLSDRKNVGLINAIVAEITDELRIEAAKKDPATAADFKKSTGIPLASRPLDQITRQNAYLKDNPNAPQTLPYSSIEKLITANSGFKKVPVLDTPEKAREFVRSLRGLAFALPMEIVTKTSFYNPSGRIFPNYDKNKKYINLKTGKQSGDRKSLALGFVKNESEGRKKFEAIEKAFNEERDALIKDLKKNSTVKLYGAAIGFTARDFAKSMGKTPSEILANKEYIINQNAKAVAMHKQVWKPLYEFVKQDPKNNAATVGFLMKNGSKTATHWHRAGIEMVGTSEKFEGGVTYEHAMPMVSAYLALIDNAANGVPFDISYPAIQSNYKLLALSDKDDKKLNGPYKAGMGDGWNFYTGNWKERYFNPTVAVFDGGINPASIIDLNGENYADKYNIDNKGFSTTNLKARILDFDDTVVKTKSNVLYTLPNGKQGSLDATQFAKQFSKLEKAGATFDYSEFSKVKNGTKGPLADLMKRFTEAKGKRDVFILTARPADANVAIQEFLKEALGIDIPLENITGLADGKPSAKADWIAQKVKEGYNDIFFADDAPANVKAVKEKLEKLNVISRVQQAKEAPATLASKPLSRVFYEDGDGVSQIESPLSREFNKMLEKTKGVKAEAVYSDARAAKMGAKKGFQVFVPYSAEDFLGLIYPTLGKGEQGNKDLKWWKDNVMTPYNDGMTNFESAKQAAMIEWNQIKDQIKETPTNLGKKAVRDFSNEDAIRVYLWDQKGVVPDGLSKKDISALTKHVKDNPELQDFANQVAGLNINGYPDPTKGWLAGTITTDLVNHVNTSTRSEMLEPWQRAIDEIYSKDNKNKLRATYGDKYIEALDDALYRMKTGRNRPSGANRITNNWLNWVNDSVGTIMFLNQRSAILQTISSINFINWTDNNPAAAAKAFANQKQYWSDFTELFNSDFLKQRRSGLKTDVNADEIAQQAAGSTNKVRAGLSLLLKKGFLPTQIADSFAIASGGSTFYRNRINSLIKEGMSEADAKKQAFSDFRDSANESQQSSDPSRISMEQASSLGRVILAFANTPIQYTRLTKRAVQDLAAGRGDWKSNVSKILYYGAVQNIIFTTLQQAMFGMLFSDDDDEFQNDKKDKAVFNIANSTADTFLRGSGVAGAFVAMLKNMALEIKKQSDKKTPNYTDVADKLFSVSPPIDSKFRKLKSAGRTFTYKQELQKMRDRGVALDNPALMAIAQVISAFGNIPADRVLRKLNNIVESTNSENAIWQRIALAMGWGEWELGITDRKTKEEKAERKSFQDLEKSIGKVVKIREKEEAKEDKKTPIKALEAGVLGEANRDGSIIVAKGLSKEKRKEVIRHEKVHQKEISSGKLDYDDNFVYYGKKKYERINGKIMHNGKAKIEGDHSLPWEKVAHKH
jgi:hypothetical protein